MRRAFVLGILLAAGCASPSTTPPSRPNVVMIVSDDQAWTDFGFMGHPTIRTPHLDKLAAESAVFPHAYVPTSLCRASLATLLTGQYAHQHKICCNDPPDGVDRSAMLPFLQNAPTIPRLLGQAGYKSLQTGKFWEGHFSNGGFTHGMTTKGRHGEEGLKIGRDGLKPITDFIDECGRDPFFVWYAPMLPHEPHNPPDRLLKKYAVEGRNLKLAKYWAMCEWFDETCGQMLEALDRKGLRDNTIVIFTVDNGWIQETGEKRTTRGNFAPKSKLSPYDGGLRNPVMIRWPGHAKPGIYPDLVSTVDLAPTTLLACGLRPTAAMQGLDLMKAASGQGRLGRDSVFGEIFVHSAVDLQRPELNLTHRWIRVENWKMILPKEGRAELYDLEGDPFEERDQAHRFPERIERFTHRLDQWWNAVSQK